jgi:hypothetical protein
MGALALLVAALWFWLYLRPMQNNIYNLQNNIAERQARISQAEMLAMVRSNNHANLVYQLEVRGAEWEVASADLPQTFRDTDVLRHIQRNIYPHATSVDIRFNESERRPYDELYSTIIDLEFETSYWQFLSILYHLTEEEALGNRIVTYRINVTPMPADDFLENVIGVAEYIPEHIRAQFVADFHAYHAGADVQFDGLYNLRIDMQVEYLSLEPGLLSESDMRMIWEDMEVEE